MNRKHSSLVDALVVKFYGQTSKQIRPGLPRHTLENGNEFSKPAKHNHFSTGEHRGNLRSFAGSLTRTQPSREWYSGSDYIGSLSLHQKNRQSALHATNSKRRISVKRTPSSHVNIAHSKPVSALGSDPASRVFHNKRISSTKCHF